MSEDLTQRATLELLLGEENPVSLAWLTREQHDTPFEIDAAVRQLIEDGLAERTMNGFCATWPARRSAQLTL